MEAPRVPFGEAAPLFMMRRESWDDTQKSWAGSGFPLTIGFLVLQLGIKFIGLVAPGTFSALTFLAPGDWSQPWQIVTYPFVIGGEFFRFLFMAGLTYWFCGSLERSWGTRPFAVFFFGMTVFSALMLILGAVVLQVPIPAIPMLPLAAMAVAWGVLNAHEMVNVMFIPMRGIFISLIAVLVLVFDYAGGGPKSLLILPFILAGFALSFHLVKNRKWSPAGFYSEMPIRQKPRLRLVPKTPSKPRDDRFTLRDLNPLEWLAKRHRRKKFERLMKDD